MDSPRSKKLEREDDDFSSDSLSCVSLDSLDYNHNFDLGTGDHDGPEFNGNGEGDSDSLEFDVGAVENSPSLCSVGWGKSSAGKDGNCGVHECVGLHHSGVDTCYGLVGPRDLTGSNSGKDKHRMQHALRHRSLLKKPLSFWHQSILVSPNLMTSEDSELEASPSLVSAVGYRSCLLEKGALTLPAAGHSLDNADRTSDSSEGQHPQCQRKDRYAVDNGCGSLHCDDDGSSVEESSLHGLPGNVGTWSQGFGENDGVQSLSAYDTKQTTWLSRHRQNCFRTESVPCQSLSAVDHNDRGAGRTLDCKGPQLWSDFNRQSDRSDTRCVHLSRTNTDAKQLNLNINCDWDGTLLSPTPDNSLKATSDPSIDRSQHTEQVLTAETPHPCGQRPASQYRSVRDILQPASWDTTNLLTATPLVPDLDLVDQPGQSIQEAVSPAIRADRLQSPESHAGAGDLNYGEVCTTVDSEDSGIVSITDRHDKKVFDSKRLKCPVESGETVGSECPLDSREVNIVEDTCRTLLEVTELSEEEEEDSFESCEDLPAEQPVEAVCISEVGFVVHDSQAVPVHVANAVCSPNLLDKVDADHSAKLLFKTDAGCSPKLLNKADTDSSSELFDKAGTNGSSRPLDKTDIDGSSRPLDKTDIDGSSRPLDKTDTDGSSRPLDKTDIDGSSRPLDKVDTDGSARLLDKEGEVSVTECHVVDGEGGEAGNSSGKSSGSGQAVEGEIIHRESTDGPGICDDEAKLKASISWIMTKAYGKDIPRQIKDPFYENAKGQLQVKPQLINLLTSSELYCQACSNMFSDTASQWQGHWNIIQVLSRKGIYVAEAGDTTVTETVLMHTAPFKVAAHLALMDALMKAYASEIASAERVVKAVRHFVQLSASCELPKRVDEALVFWINKTCTALAAKQDLQGVHGEALKKLEAISKTSSQDVKSLPNIADIMKALADGSGVAATISFYQPDTFPVADVCLKRNMGIADSLYNLRLIRSFCEQHLVLKCFHFTYEDLLYCKENLCENVLVFLAELFFLLEAMQLRGSQKDSSAEGSSRVSVRRPPSPSRPQVSSGGKRSCQRTGDDSHQLTEKITASPRMNEKGSYLENVCTSWSDDMTSGSGPDPVSSVDIAECETAQPRLSGSLASRQEQLLPAQLRFAKEKVSQHSKAEELEEPASRQKMGTQGKLTKVKITPPDRGSHRRVHGAGGETRTPHYSGSSTRDGAGLSTSGSPGSRTHDSGNIIPRAEETSAAPSSVAYQSQQNSHVGTQRTSSVQGDKPGSGYSLGSSAHDSQTAHPGFPVMTDSASDLSVDGDFVPRHFGNPSREGSIASSRSSGEFSDHESHKIHQDHKARESLKNLAHHDGKHLMQSPAITAHQSELEDTPRQGYVIRDHLDNRDDQTRPGSGYDHSQQGQAQTGDVSTSSNVKKSSFLQKGEGSVKKATTFAQLPNETTWQERAQRTTVQHAAGPLQSSPSNGERPPLSELSQLRLKLEEKRREIERKKQRQEVQTAKMRQRLGKAAFMRVISKKEDGGSAGRPVWTEGQGSESSSSPSLTQTLLQERLGQMGPEERPRPTSLIVISPSSSTSTSASQSPSAGGRPFSREGIQQTIDGVKRRWFHGSDPEGELIYSNSTTDDTDGGPVNGMSFDMMQSCPPSVASAAFGYSPQTSSSASQEAASVPVDQERVEVKDSHSTVHRRESSQSPHRTGDRRSSSEVSEDKEDYDQSLDKLNRNLAELQGEISRLTLQQQEQFLVTQSRDGRPEVSQHPTRKQPPPSSKTAPSGGKFHQHPEPEPVSEPVPHPTPVPSVDPQGAAASSVESDSAGNGFFVSFGQDTPRRSKPQLGLGRETTVVNNSSLVSDVPKEDSQRASPRDAVSAAGEDRRTSHSGVDHSLQSASQDPVNTPDQNHLHLEKQETEESEMERKKYRLMLKQQKRKEEQERKREQKMKEAQLKQELKLLKEEEQEKKKAEEKARREAIFQQYLQRKQEQEEEKAPSSAAASVNRRDHSSHRQPRPKSMFAKPRASPADVEDSAPARGLVTSSSQEDLSSHSSPAGSTASLSRFRFYPNSRGKIRKAVSCNQLTQNGSQGTGSHRRPPSPGTKLYVKPSAKSNRHIIINALSYCCLAGIVNTDLKNKVLEEIARSAAKHFLILFRDHGCQYRGLYSFDPDTEEAMKILGVGPRQLSSEMVERFYKYNSGGKSFTEVTSTKHLSVSIDAVVLKNVYWKSKVTSAAKR